MRKSRLRLEALEARETPADVSAPAMLQWFESTYANIEKRLPDFFRTGYGTIWSPPTNRADQGNFSVGYDPYDRFDVGGPDNYTLYGSETGLKKSVVEANKAAGLYFVDLVWNHNGYSDRATSGFVNAGGYPGVWIGPVSGSPIDGDFHAASQAGDLNGRLAGLIDIDQSLVNNFVRNPVPGFANNLPAGTTPAFGRLANVPTESNRRFYPDQQQTPIMVFDPTTGEANIPIYPFNNANPGAGDPVAENALGYLMRNARWLVQAVGVDGFRLDAIKHMPTWVLNYFDRAVYRSSTKPLLDGSAQHVFAFGEAFDGNKAFLQQFVKKNIDNGQPGVIGGNRDVLDFPLFFAMHDNLTDNGFNNDWRDIVNASFDSQDDGLANNGSQGVVFVNSHDNDGPYLSNVAYAYALMRPGNMVVYHNAKEFGNGRDFPKDGRGDALGGLYGDAITKLVQLRNAYGRGNYRERYLTKESLIYERENSALVVLSNRLDQGNDAVTVQTAFPPGTYLLEQTGNAASAVVDPNNDFPEVLQVQADGKVNLRIPRNKNANGVQHNNGYFIYAPSGPQGTLTIVGANGAIAGETPSAGTNGTALLATLPVITTDSFQIKLDTVAVNLLGSLRDQDADGDNAIFRIDGGLDFNGNGKVDLTAPGSVSYGFEQFTTQKAPGYGSATGNGTYVQTIDATQLSEGVHYITVRAFRHRTSGLAIFKDFRVAVYVDRLDPVASVASFNPIVAGVNENRRAQVRSTDLTANNIHVFLDLPAALTEAQVLAMVGGGSQAVQSDRDLWRKDFNGLTSGNHVLTVVSYERNGTAGVQRFPNYSVSSINGAGLGDLNYDGQFSNSDVVIFNQVLVSNNGLFNPAADFNGDGLVNNTDLLQFGQKLVAVNATTALTLFRSILGPATTYSTSEGNGVTLTMARPAIDTPSLAFSWDLNNDGTFGDAVGAPVNVTWSQLSAVGINMAGSYPIAVRTTAGAVSLTQSSTLVVTPTAPRQVQSTAVNDGSAQRSRVTMLTVTFDGVVTLATPPELAFTLSGPGGSVITVSASTAPSTPTQTIVQLTFSGPGTSFGSLDDGHYLLTLDSNSVTDALGRPLDGDANGTPGGTYTFNMHRLFGDGDGDGDVDATDFGAFRAAFGGPDLTFDFDNDGDVDTSDFSQFRSRFGTAI